VCIYEKNYASSDKGHRGDAVAVVINWYINFDQKVMGCTCVFMTTATVCCSNMMVPGTSLCDMLTAVAASSPNRQYTFNNIIRIYIYILYRYLNRTRRSGDVTRLVCLRTNFDHQKSTLSTLRMFTYISCTYIRETRFRVYTAVSCAQRTFLTLQYIYLVGL
jgi:hypothetical protein